MRLIQSAKLNEHDPYEHLKELQQLTTQSMRAIAELLPHNWELVSKV
jgi:transposase